MYWVGCTGILSNGISKHSNISPPPSLRSHSISLQMGVFSDYQITALLTLYTVGRNSCGVEPGNEARLGMRPTVERCPPTAEGVC